MIGLTVRESPLNSSQGEILGKWCVCVCVCVYTVCLRCWHQQWNLNAQLLQLRASQLCSFDMNISNQHCIFH